MAAGYPHLGQLVAEWAPRFLTRYRKRYSARAVMYVLTGAQKSLPERPTELEFKAWFAELRRGGDGRRAYAAGTCNRFRETLHTLYEYARTRGGPWHNPLADVEPLKDDAEKRVPLNERNIRTYYERSMMLLEDARDRALVAVLRFTALRISEVLGLQAVDIDWHAEGGARLHIVRQREEGSYAAQPLKHVRQRRFIRIHPELERRLRDVLRLGPAQVKMGSAHRAKGAPTVECPYLFPHRVKPMRKLARKLKAMLPEGEWPAGQAFHAFRHAWAIEAYKGARMPLDEISRWMGHSSMSVTEAYLRELMGYDSPVTALERLWSAQSGEPVPVTGSGRAATKTHPGSVLRPDFGPAKSEGEGKKWD